VTETDIDPDLSARLHAVAHQVSAPHPDIDRVTAHADRRRRRRWATTGTAGVLVVVALAVGVVAATSGDDATTFSTVGASIPGSSTTTPTPTAPGTTDEPATSTSTTTTAPPDTTASTPSTALATGADPGYIVSEGDTVVWHLASGTTRVTPAPGVILRAKTVGDGTAVAVTRGPDVRMYHLAPGEVLGEVPVPASLSDLWTAGLVDGRPTLVGETFATPNRLVAVDIGTGEETELATAGEEEGIFQPSMTADGRVLATIGWPPTCRTVLIDVATGVEEPTGLEGCGFERAIAPDGATVVDTSDDFAEIVRYDVATGAETGRQPASRPVAGEGFQIEYDGTRTILSNAYDDELHEPYEVLDMDTGEITPLPGRGPASVWIDPDA